VTPCHGSTIFYACPLHIYFCHLFTSWHTTACDVFKTHDNIKQKSQVHWCCYLDN
jgi:hypothetical protein